MTNSIPLVDHTQEKLQGPGVNKYQSVGDLVLDPTCGSGTACAASLRLGRRFIGIDLELAAIDITWKRITDDIKNNDHVKCGVPCLCCDPPKWTRSSVVHRLDFTQQLSFDGVPNWDNGDSYIVRGDALTVLKTMPDSFVDLVVWDPPFNTGREFKSKEGAGYSDKWKWTNQSDEYIAEIEAMQEYSDVKDFIPFVRRFNSEAMAAYLVWVARITIELRRIMGSTEIKMVDKYAIK